MRSSQTTRIVALSLVLLFGVGLLFLASPAVAASTADNGTTEVLVVFDDPPPELIQSSSDPIAVLESHADERIEPLHAKANTTDGLDIDRQFWIVPAAIVTVDTEVTSLETLAKIEGVVTIETDLDPIPLQTTAATTSENISPSYGLEQLDVPAAWGAFETKGAGSTIAILDTGIDGDHPDLDVAKWKDFDDDPSSDPIDYSDHGTHVAGIAAGNTSGGSVQYGVAPEADLYVGAVATDCDPRCSASVETLIDGMEWATAAEADVISISLGADAYLVPVVNVTRNANAAGVTVVASAGNDGPDTSLSPGNVYEVIAVGATDRGEAVWAESSGEEIDRDVDWESEAPDDWPETYVVPDVVAPGVDVVSAVPGDDRAEKTGTSMAAPHVGGVIALMQSGTDDELSPIEIRTALTETAWKPDGTTDVKDTRYGYGIVDAPLAIESVRDPAKVKGTIDADLFDAPVANATVTVRVGDRVVAETTTAGNGTYLVEDVPSRNDVTIDAHAPGYHGVALDIETAPGETHTMDISLNGNATIEVVAFDAVTQTPIVDGSVVIEREDGASTDLDTVTDEDGMATATIPGTGETYVTAVHRDGYKPTDGTTVVEDGGVGTVDLAIPGDGTVSIDVLDEQFEVPIGDATVELMSERGTYPAKITDEGTILVERVPSDVRYELLATAPGYEPVSDTDIDVESGATVDQTLRLPGNAAFDITVTDMVTGAPIEGATVVIERPDGATVSVIDESDRDASLTIPTAGIGHPYELTIEAHGYDPMTETRVLEANETAAVVAELAGERELDIEVVGERFDEPIPNATVILQSDRGEYPAIAGEAGQYTVPNLPSDAAYDLSIVASGYTDFERPAVTPNDETVTTALTGSATVTVRVETEDGERITEASVVLERETGDEADPIEIDGEQPITVPGTNEAYTITASADGYEPRNVTTAVLGHGDHDSVVIALPADSLLPGFGVVAALIGVLVATVLFRRRR